jgi:hypothetical protein
MSPVPCGSCWTWSRPLSAPGARQRPPRNGNVATIPSFIRADFAGATRDVLYAMAIIMAVAALVALRGLRRGVQEDTQETAAELATQSRGWDPDAPR